MEGLLALANGHDVAGQVRPDRLGALRAFLEERVAIRERAALMSRARPKRTESLRIPHRSVALSLAAEVLPALLNDRVRKAMHFTNAGAARTVTRWWPTHDGKGERVAVIVDGAGGVLDVSERVQCDSLETSLNYALAVLLDKRRNLGNKLCRCHADGCGHFWLLSDELKVKPSRNYCPTHIGERERLGSMERKRRQRAK